MRLRQLLLLGAAGLALIACSKQPASGDRTANNAPPQRAATAAKPTATPGVDQNAKAEKPNTLTRLNEDGSETVEETTGDSSAHNSLLAAVASTVTAATPSAAAATLAAPTLWQEGVHYTRLVPAQPTDVPAGQVEVLEFFWYACPHCNALEPLVEAWEKSKPAYITFTREHVLWNEGHRSQARLFFTLQAMGKLNQLRQMSFEQVHSAVFKEIHENGDPLVGPDPNNAAAAERVQLAFIKKLGLSETDFEKAYHSFDVENAMQKADLLVQRYRVSGVPTFVINGKYIADVVSAGGADRGVNGGERLMSLVTDLAAQEHKH
jgi:protein dithiol oxidoreductase (disulfide-forming)